MLHVMVQRRDLQQRLCRALQKLEKPLVGHDATEEVLAAVCFNLVGNRQLLTASVATIACPSTALSHCSLQV